jgi:hypothetical protein
MLPTACTPVKTVPQLYGHGTAYSVLLVVDRSAAIWVLLDDSVAEGIPPGQALDET